MPHTLVIFSQQKACNGLTFVTPAGDQSQTPAGNGISTPIGFNTVLGAYALSVHCSRGRLVSPSLRKWANMYIAPVDAAANPPTSPAFQYYGFDSGLPVTPGDELDFELDNINNNERTDGLLWLGAAPVVPVEGKMFTAEFTSTTPITANQWNLGTLIPTTSLEAGLYQVVGMYAHYNGAVAARLVFPGVLNSIRPGCIASQTANLEMPPAFRFGELGIWGVFQAAVLPQCEFFGTAATSSERVYLDLVKGPTGLQAAMPPISGFGALYSGNP